MIAFKEFPEWGFVLVPLFFVTLLGWATVVVILRKIRKEKIGKFGWAIVVVWASVSVLATTNIIESNKTPDQRAEETRKAAENARVSYSPAVVEMAVKRLLRDPDSAKFGKMSVYGDRKLRGEQVVVVCGSVNAKNGFGGYGGSKDFVFVKETLTAVVDTDRDNAHFVTLWNALCAGKHN